MAERRDSTAFSCPFLLRGFAREGASLPPFADPGGLNLGKAKKKAAGGSGVQGRRWHNDSPCVISAADAT